MPPPLRLALAALLLATGCAPSRDAGPRPRSVPPYLPLGGAPIARLGEAPDPTFFRPVPSAFDFGLGRLGPYFATIPGPPAGHEYTIVSVDDRSRINCIVAWRYQRPEATLDSAVRLLGRPMWRHSAHNLTQLFWWDDASVLVVGGLEHMQSIGVGMALKRLDPGERFDTLTPPLC